jgi:UDPglucose--hexose-1-phosphate uridylyltransferase
VRVVPNKYPALANAADQQEFSDATESIFIRQPGMGAHEVVVASPRHITCLSELPIDETKLLLQAFQDRLEAHQQVAGLVFSQAFMNIGPEAGASIEHLHGQVFSLSFVPPFIDEQLAGAGRFYRQHQRCVYCHLAEAELSAESRIVFTTDQFVAFCPFAGRFAYEMWLVPRRHLADFGQLPPAERDALAKAIHEAVVRLTTALARPAYNLCLHTCPFDLPHSPHTHWHVTLFPRLGQAAGFEWATGCHINATAPEHAAAVLRDAPPRL